MLFAKTLGAFESPIDGEVTVCMVDGRINTANYEYANVSVFTNAISDLPKVHITRDLLHPTGSREDTRALFLPVNEPFLKKLIQVYNQHGFIDTLRAATEHESFVIKKTAALVLTLVQGINVIRKTLSYHIDESDVAVITNFAQTKLWSKSPIRCISWHFESTKIAVAALDDTVRIYSSDSELVPLLKCRQQKSITCLSWRPLSNSDLAVGCENGILVWNIDPNSLVTRPSINNAFILFRIEHKPVISLAWSLWGDMLTSAAANDPQLLVWNVELNMNSSLKRRGGGVGNVFLKWAPHGTNLFSATTGVVFRVWECQRWQAERWSLLSGRIQAACWSPCGTVLVFTTTADPVIYALAFNIQSDLVFTGSSKNSPNQAIVVFDTTKVDVNGFVIGGIIQSMDWDTKGEYLAVVFQDNNYVAIFKATLRPVLQLTASCLVSGLPEEVATVIEFQRNFKYGACLSIAWSSGRLQHFPIVNSGIASPQTDSASRNQTNSSLHGSFSMFKSMNNSSI